LGAGGSKCEYLLHHGGHLEKLGLNKVNLGVLFEENAIRLLQSSEDTGSDCIGNGVQVVLNLFDGVVNVVHPGSEICVLSLSGVVEFRDLASTDW
jgi:hypothetical protein